MTKGRPFSVEALVARFAADVRRRVLDNDYGAGKASASLRGVTVRRISELFPGDKKAIVDMKRRTLLSGLFGKLSSADLTDAECRSLLAWSSCLGDDDAWHLNPDAITEAGRVVLSVEESKGQQRLF